MAEMQPAEIQVMDRDDGQTMLSGYDSLFVKQTKKGCLQEIMGCEATNEFKIYPSKDQANGTETFYSLEESTCFMRICCKNQRSFTQTIWGGTKDARGPVVMTLKKDWSCPVAPCTCCCIPAITYMGADGLSLGSADIPMFLCLPKILVKDAVGTQQYTVQMPSCFGGICVDPFAEGCCNCKIPFYIYPPGSSGDKNQAIGKIIKLWRGMGTEVFTDAASFDLQFPPGIDEPTKARLLGSTMFINMLFFEKGNE